MPSIVLMICCNGWHCIFKQRLNTAPVVVVFQVPVWCEWCSGMGSATDIRWVLPWSVIWYDVNSAMVWILLWCEFCHGFCYGVWLGTSASLGSRPAVPTQPLELQSVWERDAAPPSFRARPGLRHIVLCYATLCYFILFIILRYNVYMICTIQWYSITLYYNNNYYIILYYIMFHARPGLRCVFLLSYSALPANSVKIYIYIYIYVCICMCVYIYIYI